MAETQQTLFEVGADPFNGTKHPARPCVPALIGSGPDGETCGSCRHLARVQYHDKTYRKCGLVRRHWTHGEGSDVKAAWSACRYWERPLVTVTD